MGGGIQSCGGVARGCKKCGAYIDDVQSLLDGSFCVEGEAGVDFG